MDDEEPLLKYSQVSGDSDIILNEDSASTMATCGRYIVIGTHNGLVHVANMKGQVLKSMKMHMAAVNEISIDAEASFAASASTDGKICIFGITSTEHEEHHLKRPVRCVAIDPHYATRSLHQFISGSQGGQLLLHERGWLGYKENVLFSSESPIMSVSWHHNYVAFSTDDRIGIYQLSANKMLGFIPMNDDNSFCKAHFFWSDDSTLHAGWANYIKTIKMDYVVPRPTVAEDGRKNGHNGDKNGGDDSLLSFRYYAGQKPYTKVHVERTLELEGVISGLVFSEGGYLVLTFGTLEEQDSTSETLPELSLIFPDGTEYFSDVLSVHDPPQPSTRRKARYHARDFSLRCGADDDSFFVLGPKDIIGASKRDFGDHINYLIDKRDFGQALEALNRGSDDRTIFKKACDVNDVLSRFDKQSIGINYLDLLLSRNMYKEAAEKGPAILGNLRSSWEAFIYKFAEHGQLLQIAPYVPTNSPRLEPLVYEIILAFALAHDLGRMYTWLDEWPAGIYSATSVISALNKRRVQHRQRMKAEDETDRLYYSCLALVLDKHPATAYGFTDLRVELYALYDHDKLLPLLKESTDLRLDRALDLCREQNLVKEEVFLLSRMGDNRSALTLILNNLSDIPEAVRFVKEKNDRGLWAMLFEFVEKRPHLIVLVMQNTDALDTLHLIRRIPASQRIEGLYDALLSALRGFDLQQLLLESGCTILAEECRQLSSSFHALVTRGHLVDTSSRDAVDNSHVVDEFSQTVVQFLSGPLTHLGNVSGEKHSSASFSNADILNMSNMTPRARIEHIVKRQIMAKAVLASQIGELSLPTQDLQ